MPDDSIFYTNQFKWKSLSETWRYLTCPVWLKPIALLFTALRLVLGNKNATCGFPRPDHLNLVDQADIPADLETQLEPPLMVFESEGFTLQFRYVIRGIGALAVTTYAAVLLDSAGTSYVIIAGESASPRKVLFSQIRCSIQSRLTDGSLLITTLSPKLGSISDVQPSHWRVKVLPPATAESDLLITHQARLDDTSGQPIIFDRETLQGSVLDELLVMSDFAVEQGWCRELTEDEVDALLFAEVEQKEAAEQRLADTDSGEEAKRLGRQKRIALYLQIGIVVVFALAAILGYRAQHATLANFDLRTPEQTIAFEIARDLDSIIVRAKQKPFGPDAWQIERRVGLVRDIGTTPASIEPDLAQKRIHFQIGATRLDFDLQSLEFVSADAEHR